MTAFPASIGRNIPGWAKRVCAIVIGLVAWFATQSYIGSRVSLVDPAMLQAAGDVLTSGDRLLLWSAPLHDMLATNVAWSNALLIVSSAVIDALGIFIFVKAIRGPSLRPFLGLFLLFALRQLSQVLISLPPPSGVLWHDPGFPSLLVTYGVSNDFFFSGHTAMAVYGATELARLKNRLWLVPGLLVVVLEVTTVIVLRSHYTMDVIGGAAVALLACLVSGKIAPAVDRIFR